MLGLIATLGALKGSDTALWLRPAVLAPGGPLVLLWWQVVVRPRHRWWAFAAALGVTIGAYLALHRLILAGLPFPWDGVVSFAVAGWLGAVAYVAVTQRPTVPFSHVKAAERSKVEPGEVYEARFGFTRKDLLLVPVSAVLVAVGVLILRDDPVPGFAAAVSGGGLLLMRLAAVLSGRVALRVDAAGITLGHVPPWPASQTAVVPWSDIEAVVLWTQHAGLATVPYLGLQRRPGLPPLPGSARSRGLRRMNQIAVAHIPPAVLADSRPTTFWRLHRPSLTATVHHFAPAVEIVEVD